MDMGWFSFFAVCLFVHQFILLFNSIGHALPVRYLFGTLGCLQYCLGPAIAYSGVDEFQYFLYKMMVTEDVYFSFALPAMLCFIIGLHITAGKLEGEVIPQARIRRFIEQNSSMPYYFVVIGFVSSLISGFFSNNFALIFYILGSFKFIGAFMLILGSQKIKPVILALIYGSIILSSLGEGMFHDLLTWLIFLGSVLALKYKPGVQFKTIVSVCFLLMVVVIQQLKGSYRTAIGREQGGGGVKTFTKVYEKQNEEKSIFSMERLAPSNVRINQGFIITRIMITVPFKVPYQNGDELYQILEAALLPRFLSPNKLRAGDKLIFEKYTGMALDEGTSMGLGAIGDGYINFGSFGGCIFMFFLGLFYSEILKLAYRQSKYIPLLILFTPLGFYYPIRPDCELQTSLGHLIKSAFLVGLIIIIWKNKFSSFGLRRTPSPVNTNINS